MKQTLKKILLLTLVVTLCLGQSISALASSGAQLTAEADAVFAAAGVSEAGFPSMSGLNTGAGLTKNESVFVLLNNDGTVQEQIVSSWLHSDDGLSGVRDVSTLNDIVNLKSAVQPRRSGSELLWDTRDRDVYYQGTTAQSLPVTVKISYKLNGREISAEQLAGQSGAVEIRVKLQNQYAENVQVDGKTRPVAPVFLAAVLVNLPAEHFFNVDAPDGMLLSESENQMVTFAGIPGLRESFDGIMEDKLTDLRDKMKDELVITAQAEDFTLPPVMIAVANDSELFSGITYDAEADLDELLDGIDDLNEATDELYDGTDRLSDAGVDFNTNMQKLLRNYNKFHDGVREAREGTSELSNAVNGIAGTAGSMLRQGNVDDMKLILNNTANLLKLKAELDTTASQLPPELLALLTGPNTENSYAMFADTVCGKLAQPAAAMLAAHREELLVLLGASTPDVLDSGFSEDSGAEADMLDSGFTEDDTDSTESQASVSALVGPVKAMLLADLQPQLRQAWQASRKAAATYTALSQSCAELERAAKDLTANLPPQVQKKLQPLLAGLGDPAKTGAALDALAAELSGALSEMRKQTGKLSAGLDALCSASVKVQSAVLEFTDATDELQNKTAQLADGLHEFRADGIQELTGEVNDATGDARELIHIKDAVNERSQAFTTYTGAPEGAKTSVKFVMRTAEIKPEKAPEPEPEPEQKTTFSERVKNLFS